MQDASGGARRTNSKIAFRNLMVRPQYQIGRSNIAKAIVTLGNHLILRQDANREQVLSHDHTTGRTSRGHCG